MSKQQQEGTSPMAGASKLSTNNPKFSKKSKRKSNRSAKSKKKSTKTKADRPPPPRPTQGSIGINVVLMNISLPSSLKPDELSSLKELAKIVSEADTVAYETFLILLGIAVGKFDDFRDEQNIDDDSNSKAVLSLNDKIQKVMEKYCWLALTEAPIGETARQLLENLENEGIVTRVDGTDRFKIE